MNRTSVVVQAALLVVLAGSATAQPGQPPPQPPPPPPQAPTAAGAPATMPAPQPPQPYPPPSPYQPPPPPQPYQPPTYQPPPPMQGPLHEGMTVGVDLGFGVTSGSSSGGGSSSESGLSGLNLTLGGFMSPTMAIAFRLSSTAFWVDAFGDSIQFENVFAGGVVQYWPTPQFFVGGGAGVAIFAAPFETSDTTNGFAINGRAGFAFSQTATSGFHVALELSPSFYSEGGSSTTITSIGFQIGWQHY